MDVQSQELYQLAMFLQEALVREEVLNKKLRTLQAFVEQAKENSDNGWLVRDTLLFFFVLPFLSQFNERWTILI